MNHSAEDFIPFGNAAMPAAFMAAPGTSTSQSNSAKIPAKVGSGKRGRTDVFNGKKRGGTLIAYPPPSA